MAGSPIEEQQTFFKFVSIETSTYLFIIIYLLLVFCNY